MDPLSEMLAPRTFEERQAWAAALTARWAAMSDQDRMERLGPCPRCTEPLTVVAGAGGPDSGFYLQVGAVCPRCGFEA